MKIRGCKQKTVFFRKDKISFSLKFKEYCSIETFLLKRKKNYIQGGDWYEKSNFYVGVVMSGCDAGT